MVGPNIHYCLHRLPNGIGFVLMSQQGRYWISAAEAIVLLLLQTDNLFLCLHCLCRCSPLVLHNAVRQSKLKGDENVFIAFFLFSHSRLFNLGLFCSCYLSISRNTTVGYEGVGAGLAVFGAAEYFTEFALCVLSLTARSLISLETVGGRSLEGPLAVMTRPGF